MSRSCWSNGTRRVAGHRVARHLRFVQKLHINLPCSDFCVVCLPLVPGRRQRPGVSLVALGTHPGIQGEGPPLPPPSALCWGCSCAGCENPFHLPKGETPFGLPAPSKRMEKPERWCWTCFTSGGTEDWGELGAPRSEQGGQVQDNVSPAQVRLG